jgi:hypothetical protein
VKEELFGGWGIDWEIFVWILSHLPKGSTILELGSGKSSAELNRYYNLYSVEHASHYIGMYYTNYIYAPSPDVPPNEKSWYGKFEIPKYDLLLIDGPDHGNRRNILDRMELFNWSKPVIIDDMQEADLLELATKIANDYCHRPYEIIKCNGKEVIKSFMVIP